MEVVSADSNGVVGIHPQQPELGATWQIHFKMACVFLPTYLCFRCFCKLLKSRVTHYLTLCRVVRSRGAQGGGYCVSYRVQRVGMKLRDKGGLERDQASQ